MGIAAYPFDVAYRYTKFFAPGGSGFFNTPLSTSENLNLGLMQGEPGTYNFLPFESAEGATARIDWRNVIDHNDVVLRWLGPNGRYRQFGTVFGADRGPDVYKDGRIFARIPSGFLERVVSASVTTSITDPDFSGPLLHVISAAAAGFRVYRKPFNDAGGTDNSLFDAVDNPTGWKQIGDVIAYPTDADAGGWLTLHSVLFSNQSGTKARGMVQVTTIIEGSPDGVPPANSRYMEIEIDIETASRSDLGLNGGVKIVRTENRDICSTTRLNIFLTSIVAASLRRETNWLRTFVDGKKLWVDFKGDTPVYATWDTPTDYFVGNAFFNEGNCPQGGSSTGSGGANFFNSTGRPLTLNISGAVIKVAGLSDGTNEITNGNRNADNTQCSGSASHSSFQTIWDAQIKYADMRFDLVVWAEETNERVTNWTASGSHPVPGDAPATGSEDFTIIDKYVIKYGSNQDVLYQDQQNISVPVSFGKSLCAGCVGCCDPPSLPGTCNTVTELGFNESHEFVSMTLFDGPASDALGGLSIDVSLDGDLTFYSERPSDTWFDSLDVTPDFTNFLTGGDPVDITGLTGDNPRFANIRLMR